MARIRTIKPEFFVSAQVADVSPTCRLLFIGMWLFCDDAGIHPASTRQLKMEVFPGDDVTTKQLQEMVDELLRVGLLSSYEVTDETEVHTYWKVTGWHHQKIERPRYQYPQQNSTTHRRHIDDTSTSPRSLTRPDPTLPHTTTPKRVVAVYTTTFEEWWCIYPRKVQKGAAAKAFKSACQRAKADDIIAATKVFAVSEKAQGDYCPYPATWLNQNRWEDDQAEWNGKKKPKSEYPELKEVP
jgi:hypothetical protein